MELAGIILSVIILFVVCIGYSFIKEEERCSNCSKSRTAEIIFKENEYDDPLLPKAKGAGISVHYRMKCQYCGHIWDIVTEEDF